MKKSITIAISTVALGVGLAAGPIGTASSQPRTARSDSVAPTYTWPRIAHDPGNDGYSPDPAISTANAGSLGVRWMADTGAPVVASPVVEWNPTLGRTLLYVGNEAGYLTAFDQATGAMVWSDNLGSAIRSTPLVENGNVWISRTFGAQLEKIDGATGQVECSLPLSSTAEGSPTIGTPAGGSTTIYQAVNDLGTTGGPLYAVDEATCAQKFAFTGYNTPTGSWDPASYATDASGRGLVLLGTADPDTTAYAVDALTGTKVWSFFTPALSGNTDTDIGSGLTVSAPGVNGFADGVAYLPAEDGALFALDLTTGQELWQYNFSAGLNPVHLTRSTAALLGRDVIFGDNAGVVCVDAVTGTPIWTRNTGIDTLSAPAVVGPNGNEVVAVTNVAGQFDVLSAATGSRLYEMATPGFSTSSFADTDGNLITASADGFVYDLALNGSNQPGPISSIQSPSGGSTVSNPAGSLSVSGTATAPSGGTVAAVQVAIESGGPGGPWWNGASGTWTSGWATNAATLANPGTSASSWTYSVPVPTSGGRFTVYSTAVDSDGIADVTSLTGSPGSTDSTFTVATLAGSPQASVAAGQWVSPGSTVTASGHGFGPSETVQASLAGQVVGQTVTGADGSFTRLAVKIPASAAFGAASLLVQGTTSGLSSMIPVDVANSWVSAGNGNMQGGYEPDDSVFLNMVSPGATPNLANAWSYPDTASVSTTPAVRRDVVYFGDDSGGVTALSEQTSQPLWTTTLKGSVRGSPALSSTLVFVGTTGKAVTALFQANGKRKWTVSTTSAVESAPVLAGSSVVVGSDDGTVYDLGQSTGQVVWARKLGGAVHGSPAVDPAAGLVVVGDATGAITALSLSDGHVVWSRLTGGPVTANASLLNGRVYIGSGDAKVYALRESDGNSVWTTKVPGPVAASGAFMAWPSLTSNYYVAGSTDGSISYLSLWNGSIVTSSSVAGPVVGLTTAVGWVCVTTSSGFIVGFKRLAADRLFTVRATAPFAAPAAQNDGVILVGGTDHTVRAYSQTGVPIP